MKQQTKFKQTEIGMIPEDWEVKELKEVVSYITEKMNVNELNLKIFISTENMLPDKGGISDASSLPQIEKTNKFKINDILFSNIRTYFKKLWLAKFNGGCSNDVLVIRPKNSSLNNKFLYYYLSQEKFFEYTVLTSKGTKMPRGDKNAIMVFKINIPPYQEQIAIFKILSDLDSKIELNQQMNKTLEAIGQAIFKRWFIDFEFPNEKGKPYKSSGGEMIFNEELGMEIPKEWGIKEFDKFGEIICGKTPPKSHKEFFNGDVPFIKIPDMHNQLFIIYTEDSLTKEGEKYQENKTIPAKSLCISCIATVGLVSLTSKNSQTNQQINSIVPQEDFFTEYLYYQLKSMNQVLQDYGSGGSATLNINTSSFSKIKVLSPQEDILKKFHLYVKSVFDKIIISQEESYNLSQIRDSLLPRLMSGKIRVPVEVE